MFDRFRNALLPLLRLPPEPTAPFGAPHSIRVFRAGRNLYKLRLALWFLGQAATLIGIIISLGFLAQIKDEAEVIKAERQAAAATTSLDSTVVQNAESAAPTRETVRHEYRRNRQMFWSDPNNPIGRLIDHQPWWLFPLIVGIEIAGIVVYLLQLPITYALVRLEYEAHWYIVTDRSLRIRSGIVRLNESTMSFANVQQVTVSQGPLQRLLGIANVRVQSAGGGNSSQGKEEEQSMHVGVFHGVENAHEIRDLVIERLRSFRAAGLGDPDDHRETSDVTTKAAAVPSEGTLAAARELLEVARGVRAVRLS